MLSAVENHFGPSRLYATGAHHPYANNSAAAIGANSNLIAAPCPIVAVPTPMSATEFARPHPKRYNGSQSLRNGLSSPSSRSKYSQLDQSAPVNLAVSQSMPENGALVLSHKPSEVAALCAAAKPSSLESEQDAISSSIASLYQHKMPYCPPSIPDAASPLYYSNFYPRPPAGSVYGHSIYAAPSSHALGGARNPLHHGVATYPHVDSYSNPYLFGPNAYSPPAAARPNLSPHSPIGTITVGSASQTNNNTTISAQSVLPANASPLSVSPPSMFTQQQRDQQQYHMKSSSEHSTSLAKPVSSYRTEPKEKESHLSNGKSADFKIPSGKEGSLKHRILTRPFGEKDVTPKQAQKQSLPTHSQNNVVTKPSVKIKNNSNSNSSSNNNINNNNASSKNKNLGSGTTISFSKGSLIELSSGELKRVEDMRTEDFITSSSKNPNLQLIDTTVVKMMSQSKNIVLITLSYNNNKICIETQPSHPFFVYGKGWASFSPEGTLHEHGLKCQLLEVGDVCISLTPRESRQPESIATPQNLSRKQMPHTISTTATGTAVTSRQIPSYEPSYSQQMLLQRHPSEMYGMHGRPSSSENSLRKFNTTMAPPPPPSTSTDTALPTSYDDEAIDATMHSRKRRAWSISENMCEDQKKNKPLKSTLCKTTPQIFAKWLNN